MKRVTVSDAAGKPLKIGLLTDWDLLFCVPYCVLALLNWGARVVAYHYVPVPAGLLSPLVTRFNISVQWPLILFPLAIACASAVTTVFGSFSIPDLVGAILVFLFQSTVLFKIFVHREYIQDVVDRVGLMVPVSPREQSLLNRMKMEAAAVPNACVAARHDKSYMYIAGVETIVIFTCFACVIFLPPSFLNGALVVCVALFTFRQFEFIEHIASHSTWGRILKRTQAPWSLKVTEALRRYVVWALFGWYPNYYFVTHALHHHVENDGPADWQSTLRYDRTSFFDFMKNATWLGINAVVPIDTFFYLAQRRGWRFVRILARGYGAYLLLLALTAATEPVLAVFLVTQRFLIGINMYAFVVPWHGFHDFRNPNDVEASNHSLIHYAHHVKPRAHLLDMTTMFEITMAVKKDSELAVLRPEFFSIKGFWSMQARLWKKDFAGVGDCLLANDVITPDDKNQRFFLRPGLTGRGVGPEAIRARTACFLPKRRPAWLQRLDDDLSNAVARLVLRATARPRQSPSLDLPENTSP